jgi:hypothetical protein
MRLTSCVALLVVIQPACGLAQVKRGFQETSWMDFASWRDVIA